MRMLCYESAADLLDEYLQMGEDSILTSMKSFCELVVSTFGKEYLREPDEQDLRRILSINAARGFPGCVGNGELWIWHMFFGSPGSLTDINNIMAGSFPPRFPFFVNGERRTMPYYLADGIYPSWAIFAKTMKEATTAKERAYARAQEGVRKDIERAFGVLMARFHILQRPCRLWYRRDISNVVKACIILHNMIVEGRRDHYETGIASLQHFEEARNMFSNGQAFQWESLTAITNLWRFDLTEGMWANMLAS
ncbi:unnamed protein product [Chondrus crispus]|uniref:DDE Tnp4 domain-containing protein n=1 Tax=Chondrus crispus TaxID=2769 RepID=R7Q9R2_CHOCR|nr:unnamed protein product [Chondrus crispus]CDF34493.1 unnamed protein product [Chondrus crispus]|eukprot:XP_005714312.1 unnamed protein product [Chondrus crispus]